MECKMGILMENMREIYWESHWEHMVELRESPIMEYHMILGMAILTDQHGESS